MQITKDATQIAAQDHERLRSEGFDDRAILQITLIASWFNYINRVADALGVGREVLIPDERLYEMNSTTLRADFPWSK